MANFIYTKGKEKFLAGTLSWTSHDIKLLLVKATYVQNAATDEFLSIIAGADRITGSTSANFANKAVTGAIATTDPITLTGIAASQAAVAIVVYRDTGVEATSPLICYIDTATGLPFTTSGANISITFTSGVFSWIGC